jgi:biopolymer transport protein ExbD
MAGTTHLGGGGPSGDISFNYIPLIDVTFNLIVFFALTSEISSAQNARVLVPDPHSPQAVARSTMSKNVVTIAVISEAAYDATKKVDAQTAARAFRYEIDGEEYKNISDLDGLVLKIRQKQKLNESLLGKAAADEFFVEIRADSRLSFSEVTPVIMAIARAGIAKVAISAKRPA